MLEGMAQVLYQDTQYRAQLPPGEVVVELARCIGHAPAERRWEVINRHTNAHEWMRVATLIMIELNDGFPPAR